MGDGKCSVVMSAADDPEVVMQYFRTANEVRQMLEQYPQMTHTDLGHRLRLHHEYVSILADSNDLENYLKNFGRQFVGFSVQWWMGIDESQVQEEHTDRIKELAQKLEDTLKKNPNLDEFGLMKMKLIIKSQYKELLKEVQAEKVEEVIEKAVKEAVKTRANAMRDLIWSKYRDDFGKGKEFDCDKFPFGRLFTEYKMIAPGSTAVEDLARSSINLMHAI